MHDYIKIKGFPSFSCGEYISTKFGTLLITLKKSNI